MANSNNVRPLTIQLLDSQGRVLQEHHFAQEKIVVGRIVSSDLQIDDPSVSRVHALIEVLPNRVAVTDLASSHGTFINGKKILAGELKTGQQVKVGNISLVIREGGLEKVPEDFRQQYVKVAVPKGSTNYRPVQAETKPVPTDRVIEPKRQVEPKKEKSHTKAHEPKAYAKGHGKSSSATPDAEEEFDETMVPLRVRRPGESFTQEIVADHVHTMGSGHCLSVTLYWYETVLDDSVVRPPSVVHIGEGARNDYMIPMGSIEPNDNFKFISMDDAGAYLWVHPEMTGCVRSGDKTCQLSDLADHPSVKREGSLFQIRLGRKDFAKITVGKLTFFLMHVQEPPRPATLPFWEPDPTFRRIVVSVGLLLILLALFLIFSKVEKIEPSLESVSDQLRPIIINPQRIVRIAKITQEGGNEGEGMKSEGVEGQRGMPEAKQKEGITNIPKGGAAGKGQKPGAGERRAEKPMQKAISDKQVAKNAGILGALSGGLGKALGKAAGSGSGKGYGGNDPLEQLMLGMGGPGAKVGSGYGTGTGLKGTGSGGGGKAVGIGGLGTKGSGFGRHGMGKGSIPGKGEAAISTVAENIQVLGSLDKSIIDAVVRRHLAEIRYCYESELQRFRYLQGKIITTFTIGGDGRVVKSGIVQSTVNNASVESCIRQHINRWIFPAPAGGGIVIVKSYPFILSRGQ